MQQQEGQPLFSSEFDNAVEQVKKKTEAPSSEPSLDKEGNVRDIMIAPDAKLRVTAKPVETIDDDLKQLVADMLETMYKSQGMGLAATQIGSDKRVIVMDVVNLAAYEETVEQDIKTHGRFCLINPEIVESSPNRSRWAEACLSVPGFQFEIERSSFILVQGIDPAGNVVRFKASGLLAACIQHEIDHLDGKLFIDYISRLKRDMVMNKLKKLRKRGRMVVRAHSAPKF